MEQQKQFKHYVKAIYRLLVILFFMVGIITIGGIYLLIDPTLSIFKKNEPNSIYLTTTEENEDKIENGIHLRTGLVDAEGLMEVVNNCTNCHSSKLIMQNRMTTERWITTIRWMQETQNLWDLGSNEKIIVNYLVANYPPKRKGRRELLTNIEWYDLQD
ncbi:MULTISPECIES: monoheme cytochrome C [Aquimarina]|uniref:monoheme cytochrome C n=1 Tax=Aquimarina TaxID=290174 RepID=UPI0009438409|nr:MULTISPECIES: monoheme cytochrome C [Aquimarina]